MRQLYLFTGKLLLGDGERYTLTSFAYLSPVQKFLDLRVNRIQLRKYCMENKGHSQVRRLWFLCGEYRPLGQLS